MMLLQKLSPTAIRVLRWCAAHAPYERRYPGALARVLWPGKRGHGGVGYAKCAGSLLGKYRQAGLITTHGSLTELGHALLAAATQAESENQ